MEAVLLRVKLAGRKADHLQRFKVQWLLDVPPGLTLIFTFCPRDDFMCFARFSEQIAILPRHSIN
jgi:hypothetical protein